MESSADGLGYDIPIADRNASYDTLHPVGVGRTDICCFTILSRGRDS